MSRLLNKCKSLLNNFAGTAGAYPNTYVSGSAPIVEIEKSKISPRISRKRDSEYNKRLEESYKRIKEWSNNVKQTE